MSKLYVGVDNGKMGSIVAINSDGSIHSLHCMPLLAKEYDTVAIYDIFKQYKDNNDEIVVALEKAYTLPLNGCKANFTTGRQYGEMECILKVLKIPYVIIGARTWQKAIFKGQDYTKNTKDASIMWCLKRYPDVMWKRTERCTNYSDGLTDGCCLCCYAKEKNL